MRVMRKDAMERWDDRGKGSGINTEQLDKPGDEWKEAYTAEGKM